MVRSIVGSALVVALAIGGSIVSSAWMASRAYVQRGVQPYRESRALSVTGSAKRRLASDRATWSVRVQGEAKSLPEAYQRLSAAEERLKTFLAGRGFAAESVSPGPISTSVHLKKDEKGNETRDVVSYELRRTYRITEADVRRVAGAAGAATDLIREGDRITSEEPEYVYTGLAALKIEMIGEATADARARAERIASNSRCRLGAVREAKAGVLQITAPWSTDVSAGGIYDTSTIEKDVTSVVTLEIAIEPE